MVPSTKRDIVYGVCNFERSEEPTIVADQVVLMRFKIDFVIVGYFEFRQPFGISVILKSPSFAMKLPIVVRRGKRSDRLSRRARLIFHSVP